MAEYIIKRTDEKKLTAMSGAWKNANAAKIDRINWPEYPECPETEIKVMYNEDGIFVRFESQEENLITDCKNLNEDVFEDSTCEIFFNPNVNQPNYFNFEINAAGVPLIGWGSGRAPLRVRLPLKDISIFEIESIIKEKGFILKLFIPYSFMKEYAGEISEHFIGNFQKCCQKKDPEHYVTYFPVNTPAPDFHNPEAFDKMIFER